MKSNYKEDGIVIIDDFLPEDVVNELEYIYSTNNNWDVIDQVRENHYSHVFKMDSLTFPKEDEVYMACFKRSKFLEDKINDVFEKFFKPKLNELSDLVLSEFDVRCYKLDKGDFYRTHMDDYAGTIGTTFYLNKNWCWDWGGILHIGVEEDSLNSIFPKYNRLVVHDMEKFRFPHFISPVTDYAKNSRYTMVTFNK